MNIVSAGGRFQIFGEDVKTYRELPIGCYDVCFHPMKGFWLQTRDDLIVNEEKIYGTQARKVNKVFDAYNTSKRNLGIILSGPKGIGKSLFARTLTEVSLKNSLPIVVVAQYFPGIADFLASIKQRAVVLFDEFEKTFAPNKEHGDPQVEMLPLFDGIDIGQKLFVITCNDYRKLNEFLLNRPGRFHYHFTMTTPSSDEIREYLGDKLDAKYHSVIEEVTRFAAQTDLTYDTLRAIAFELNRGYSIKETLADLNIMKIDIIRYNVEVEFSDGSIAITNRGENIDFFSTEPTGVRLNYLDESETFLTFTPSNAKMDALTGKFVLAPNFAKVKTNFDYFDEKPDEETIQRLKALAPVRVEFTRVRSKTERYLMV